MNNPVYFHDGDMVKKAEKLFEIDRRMYKADLDQAEGTVKQYEAHVERFKMGLLRRSPCRNMPRSSRGGRPMRTTGAPVVRIAGSSRRCTRSHQTVSRLT